jgi:hypothetical protein
MNVTEAARSAHPRSRPENSASHGSSEATSARSSGSRAPGESPDLLTAASQLDHRASATGRSSFPLTAARQLRTYTGFPDASHGGSRRTWVEPYRAPGRGSTRVRAPTATGPSPPSQDPWERTAGHATWTDTPAESAARFVPTEQAAARSGAQDRRAAKSTPSSVRRRTPASSPAGRGAPLSRTPGTNATRPYAGQTTPGAPVRVKDSTGPS